MNDLIADLQKTYANISADTIRDMAYDAAEKAIRFCKEKGYKVNIQNIQWKVLAFFNQDLVSKAINKEIEIGATEQTTEAKSKNPDADTTKKYQNAAESMLKAFDGTRDSLEDIIFMQLYLANATGKQSLSMDVDSKGNIRFDDNDTQNAYDRVFNRLMKIGGFNNCGLQEGEVKQIYQKAWIQTYNNYNNQANVDLNQFINDVFTNMTSILSYLATSNNAQKISVITSDSAMKVVNGADEESPLASTAKIYYADTDYNLDYGDGNVHLKEDKSDKEYQKAINELKKQLKGIYVPPLTENTFNQLFTLAQKEALEDCDNNKNDITFGSTNKNGSRQGDKGYIQINELMEIVAYKFDKAILRDQFLAVGVNY